MKLSKICAATLMAAGLLATAAPAWAVPISWDIVSAASYVRLTIPDQDITIDGYTASARVRNQNGAAWSDAGGRHANLNGTIETNMNLDGPFSLNYVGVNTVRAGDDKNLRPNPTAWNGSTYTDTTTAPAAFGGKLVGSVLSQNFDAGYFAFRDIGFDIVGGGVLTTIDPVAMIYSLPSGAATFGIGEGTLAIDGVSTALPVQALTDQLISSPPLGSDNSGGTTLTNVVGFLFRLTYAIYQPIEIELTEGGVITGTATGQVVAYALLVPEPSTVVMAGVATVGLCWAGRRRFRR